MKNMMNKFWNLLAENIVLLTLIAGVGIGAFLLLWRCSVTDCLKTTISVDYASWGYWKEADHFAFPYHIARYITEDDLIGFIDDQGNEMTLAVYTDAACFSEGRALVMDQKENQYEVDIDGLKIP